MIISSHSMAQLMRNENDPKSRPYEILYFVSCLRKKNREKKTSSSKTIERQQSKMNLLFVSWLDLNRERFVKQVKGFINIEMMRIIMEVDVTSDASLNHSSLDFSSWLPTNSFSCLSQFDETRAWKMYLKVFFSSFGERQTIVRVTKCLFCFRTFSTF